MNLRYIPGILILCMLISSCGKNEEPVKKTGENLKSEIKVKYVTAKGGLNMRDKPETSSALVVNIPEGEGVQILEETGSDVTISGSTGKWTKVKWKEKTGWAFGGFLAVSKLDTEFQTVQFTGPGSLVGKTIIFPQAEMRRDQLRLTLKPDKSVIGDFLVGEYSGGKINGTYHFGDFKGGILEINISGSMKLITVTDKERIEEKEIQSKSVRISKKDNAFVGWNEIPHCPPFSESKVIITDKMPSY